MLPDLSADQPYSTAVADFRRARSQAFLKEIVARLTGESTELLSYEDVRRKLITLGSAERGLHDIPLNAIVGSVGRYSDFTREFLPRKDSDMARWSRVKVAAGELSGLPAIEVYRIGEAYFVKDGNHRVSVARQQGNQFIQAYVTEVVTRVPLTPDVRPDDLIVMAEYARFLEKTHLDELDPPADLRVSIPGQYEVLDEHITVHRYYLGQEQGREISETEAAAHWYQAVYLPAIVSIRELGILRYFANRTETDLYLWISEHRAALEQELGWNIPTDKAALHLVNQEHPAVSSGFGGRLIGVLSLGRLEAGPPPGELRRLKGETPGAERLFADVLVPVSGNEDGWFALEQALVVAGREQAHLNGLHVVDAAAERDADDARRVQAEFADRCARHGVTGKLAVTTGDISRQISTQARLNDLVVTTLLHPPPAGVLARLDSGFHELIKRCPRPVLAVPRVVSQLGHALLAYDGSPKGREALYVAASLAGRWRIPLTVATIFENERTPPETLMQARLYLEERGIPAEFRAGQGPIAAGILRAAAECGADVIVMGGYGHTPVMDAVLGSAVDFVLRETGMPVLICR